MYHALQTEVRTGEAASGSTLDTSSSVAAVAKGSEALDSLGIPGWDKVDQLARALVDLRGLSASNEQARNIQRLYHQLPDYDKKPLSYAPANLLLHLHEEGSVDPRGVTQQLTR